MTYSPLCSRKIIVGLFVWSLLLLVLKFFLEKLEPGHSMSNTLSLLRMLYVGYFFICLIYTGFIFSTTKQNSYKGSATAAAETINFNQQDIVRGLKFPIVLLIGSAILLVCLFANWVMCCTTILLILGVLFKIEYNHRRLPKQKIEL